MEFDKNRVRLNWFINERFVIKALRLKVNRREMESSDFYRLKEFSWGVLGFDYEEGLKFETSAENLAECAKWIRDFHAKHRVAYTDRHIGPVITGHVCSGGSDSHKDKFFAAGFEEHEYGYRLLE